jgi:hypothetical protein
VRPAIEIVSNILWIIDFRKWLRPNLRQIVEITSIRLQGLEISHQQIHTRQFCHQTNLPISIPAKPIYIHHTHAQISILCVWVSMR